MLRATMRGPRHAPPLRMLGGRRGICFVLRVAAEALAGLEWYDLRAQTYCPTNPPWPTFPPANTNVRG